MDPIKNMNAGDMVRTNNEWIKRYIETPEQFAREFESVTKFLTDKSEGRVPDYGERCAAYQFKLLDEMNAAA